MKKTIGFSILINVFPHVEGKSLQEKTEDFCDAIIKSVSEKFNGKVAVTVLIGTVNNQKIRISKRDQLITKSNVDHKEHVYTFTCDAKIGGSTVPAAAHEKLSGALDNAATTVLKSYEMELFTTYDVCVSKLHSKKQIEEQNYSVIV